jgi:hypothetical protein
LRERDLGGRRVVLRQRNRLRRRRPKRECNRLKRKRNSVDLCSFPELEGLFSKNDLFIHQV